MPALEDRVKTAIVLKDIDECFRTPPGWAASAVSMAKTRAIDHITLKARSEEEL
jgi:hypothetical protein